MNFLLDGRAAVAEAAPKAGAYAARHLQRRGPGRHASGHVLRTATDYVGRHVRLSAAARLQVRLHQWRPPVVHVATRGGW